MDFFPTPDTKPTFERKVRPGIFLGYFMQLGKFIGTYLVADKAGFQKNALAKPHQVRIHRVNKVISPGTIDGGVWHFCWRSTKRSADCRSVKIQLVRWGRLPWRR